MLCVRTFFFCSHVYFWADSCRPVLGVTALSWPSPSKAKEGRRLLPKHPRSMSHFLEAEWLFLSGMVTLDYPRMTGPREEGTVTKLERRQDFVRKAKRAEWRGTYCVGHDGWKASFTLSQRLFLGGERPVSVSSFLVFSLTYAANTELDAARRAKV